MNARRGSTSGPISTVKMRSASTRSLTVTRRNSAPRRVHRRLEQLRRVHLAEALVALDVEVLLAGLLDRLDRSEQVFAGRSPRPLSLPCTRPTGALPCIQPSARRARRSSASACALRRRGAARTPRRPPVAAARRVRPFVDDQLAALLFFRISSSAASCASVSRKRPLPPTTNHTVGSWRSGTVAAARYPANGTAASAAAVLDLAQLADQVHQRAQLTAAPLLAALVLQRRGAEARARPGC
jgi:hypothetical protein